MMKTFGTLLITACLSVAPSGCATDPSVDTTSAERASPDLATQQKAVALMHERTQAHSPTTIADTCDTGSALDDGVCCYSSGGCDMCTYDASYGWTLTGSVCCDQGDGTDYCCSWGGVDGDGVCDSSPKTY